MTTTTTSTTASALIIDDDSHVIMSSFHQCFSPFFTSCGMSNTTVFSGLFGSPQVRLVVVLYNMVGFLP